VSQDGVVLVWEAASGRQVLAPTGHRGALISLVFSPEGERLLAADSDRTVIWDAKSGEILLTLEEGNAAGWDPTGGRIATGGADGIITVWDAETGDKLQTISLPRGG